MNAIPVYVRPDWHADANCRGMGPDLFFPTQGESVAPVRAICRDCDVQVECAHFALNNGERFGVWGGLTERQRRAIRRAKNLDTQDDAA